MVADECNYCPILYEDDDLCHYHHWISCVTFSAAPLIIFLELTMPHSCS